MAEWAWQYSGLSHQTKLNDQEELLAHAIVVLKAADSDQREKKAKAVRKLASKVLNARLKIIGAKIREAEPVSDVELVERRAQLSNLLRIKEELERNGVDGILQEFGVAQAKAGQFVNITKSERPDGQLYACPCCKEHTLHECGGDEICTICKWEDDGQDDHDADMVRGGPNYNLSLSEARRMWTERGMLEFKH